MQAAAPFQAGLACGIIDKPGTAAARFSPFLVGSPITMRSGSED